MPQSVCYGRANVTIAFGFCMHEGCLLETNPLETFLGYGVTGSQAFPNWHHFFSTKVCDTNGRISECGKAFEPNQSKFC